MPLTERSGTHLSGVSYQRAYRGGSAGLYRVANKSSLGDIFSSYFTHIRDTLKYVKTRNLTLALPEELVLRLKVIAAQRESSISRLLTEALSKIADEETGYLAAKEGMLADLREGHDLGTHGVVSWARDSLHER